MTAAISRILTLVAVLTIVRPIPIDAQPATKMARVAYLSSGDAQDPIDAAFDAAARTLGYVEGQNLVVERRFPGKGAVSLDAVLQGVVRLNPDVIVTWGIQWSAAAKRATTTIPVVFVSVRAPVERGLVASLAKPGANVTGLSTFPVATLDPKLLELAKELLPQLSRERNKAQPLIVPGTVLQFAYRKEIIRLTEARRLPAVYGSREYVEDGGLVSLGTDLRELARRAAYFVDRILRGAKPADLPVEQPTKFELVINLKTAKSLGITIPRTVFARADRVIE